MFVIDQLPWLRDVLLKELKMHGRVCNIFAYIWSFKVVYFRSQIEFNLCLSFLQLNSLSVAYHSIKEEPNMHVLYFGCLATNLLDF